MEQSQAGLKKAAALVVDLCGEGAPQYAAQRVELLKERGDLMGATAWQRVLPIIQMILLERAADEKTEPSLSNDPNLENLSRR